MMSGQRTSSSGGFSGFDFGNSGAQYSTRSSSKEKNEDLDVTKTLNLTAQEIFDKKPITVTFSDITKCAYCSGAGYCSHCGGTGIV